MYHTFVTDVCVFLRREEEEEEEWEEEEGEEEEGEEGETGTRRWEEETGGRRRGCTAVHFLPRCCWLQRIT